MAGKRAASAIVLALALTAACAGGEEADGGAGGGTATGRSTPAGGTADTSGGTAPVGTQGTAAEPRPPVGTTPADVAQLEVVLHGMSVLPGIGQKVSYGIVYRNPNQHWIAEGVTIDVVFQNGFGVEVGKDTLTIAMVGAGAEVAAGHTLRMPGGSRFSASFRVATWRKVSAPSPPVGATAPVFDRSSINGTQLRTTISNPFDVALTDVQVVAIFLNGPAIVGGDSAKVRTVPAKGTAEAKVLAGGVFPPAIGTARIFTLPAQFPDQGVAVPTTTKAPATTKAPTTRPPASKPPGT